MQSLNHAAFLAINADAGAHGPAVWVALVAAKYLVALVPLHLVLIWVGGDRRMRTAALSGFLALIVALAANQLIGLIWYSPRPFVIGLGHTLIEHRPSSSMPSNHATMFFAYAASLMFGRHRALAGTFAALGLAVAWSRIYLGIHYPLDMLAAALVSLMAAGASTRIMGRIGPASLARAEHLWSAAGAVTRRASPRRLA